MYDRTPQPHDGAYFRDELMEWLPRILGAIAILVVAWILARAAKWAIAKVVDRVPALKRHYEAEPGKTLGSLIGDVVFWLILLVGIMLALQPLRLTPVLQSVQRLANNAFSFIPNIIGAALIFIVGLVVAKIVRRLVEGALLAANADGWMRRAGLADPAAGSPATAAGAPVEVSTAPRPRSSLSRSVATLVFYLIMIPVTIAALDALRIEAISGPATQMLRTISDAIPNVLGALILLAIGFVLGKLAKAAVEQLLPSMGFDRSVSALGFSTGTVSPSRTVGTAVMIAILLFFAVQAAQLLHSPIIAAMLAQVLELGGQVLFGTVIILAGVVIARVVSGLVSGVEATGWLPAIVRWSIIALAVAMGLRFMGLANEIVIIGFTAIIGSAAVACALAFGLGGRPTAHKLLELWTEANAAPATPRAPRAPKPPAPDDSQPPLV
ncbi:MAG TPA: mechanosensitive ion channel [Allosphingosinicella sp.]|nr:mechanosensitive ion channel [Allosphingosinicella sp.]